MKKIFISVGMKNRPSEYIEQDLARARMIIRAMFTEPVEVIDNFGCDYPGVDNPKNNKCRLWYLGEAIKKLGDCAACFFVHGWENYTGCMAERDICRLYGIRVIEEPVVTLA